MIKVTQKTKAEATDQNYRNKKYKRKRNLVKKSLQFSKFCGTDVILLFYDRINCKLEEFYTNKDI